MEDRSALAQKQYILVIEYDLSLTTGYSINERESTVALLDQFPTRIRAVCPAPAFPEEFSDPRIHYVRDHRRHHPFHYLRFLFALRRKLNQLSRERPVDAVIFRPGPLPVIPALTLSGGTPVILKKLSGYSLFSRADRSTFKRITTASARPLYRYISRGCLAADIESHAYAEWLPTVFPISPSQLKIVQNGANTETFRPQDVSTARRRYGWEKFKHIVGYVGALDELRCIESAVDAAHLLRDIPDLAFILVGGGPLTDRVRDRIKSEGLEDRVILPGFLPYTEVPQVISSFDLAIDLTRVPLSIGARTVYGSYSQKIAQYLACGVPVVAWDTPDTRFLDEEGVGRTVPIEDAGQLADTVRQLLQDPDAGPRRVRARTFACERLSAEAIARYRVDFWDSLPAKS